MAGGGVADFVDAFHDGVQRRVVAYGCISPVEVVVDCAREADYGEVELVGENARARQGTVAADYYEGVDFVASDDVVGQLAAFRRLEFLAAGSLQDCAALLDYVRHVLRLEVNDFISDEAAVAAVDALDLKASEDCRAGDGADGSIHSGGVAAGGQNAYALDFCHVCFEYDMFLLWRG